MFKIRQSISDCKYITVQFQNSSKEYQNTFKTESKQLGQFNCKLALKLQKGKTSL